MGKAPVAKAVGRLILAIFDALTLTAAACAAILIVASCTISVAEAEALPQKPKAKTEQELVREIAKVRQEIRDLRRQLQIRNEEKDRLIEENLQQRYRIDSLSGRSVCA